MADDCINVLVISTNGILKDGITAWLVATFSSMDLDGLSVTAVAHDAAERSVIEEVEAARVEVVTLPSRQGNLPAYSRALKSLLESRHFDIVHVCCNSALAVIELVLARKCGVGMRVAHSHNTMCSHRIANFLLNPLFQFNLTDRYACGRDAGKWLFGDRPFTVIPNGKNLPTYGFDSHARKVVREEFDIAEGETAFGHVGSFNEQKNHVKLIEIFAELHRRDCSRRLFLIGDGNLLPEIKEKVKELGFAEAVRFLGRRDDVPRLLNGFDCMVFPSLYEGFPNVVMEWQLNGLPVVMSDTITDECVITSLVSRVPLEAGADKWADAIERSMMNHFRAADSLSARKDAKSAGYDIKENAAMLRRLYFEGVERCK